MSNNTNPSDNDYEQKERGLQLQAKEVFWQRMTTFIASIGIIISFLAFYQSNETAQQSIKNAEISNETSQQSLKVAQEANETARLSLEASQEANKIQALPIIEVHPKEIKDILAEENKLNVFSISNSNTKNNKESDYEKLGLIFTNIGKPLLSQPSCESIDYYRITGTLINHPQHSFRLKYEWFIHDTNLRHSIIEAQQNFMTTLQGNVLSIKFHKNIFYEGQLYPTYVRGRVSLSPENDNQFFEVTFSVVKEHLIKFIYSDILENNYNKYILKITHSETKEYYKIINESEYYKRLAEFNENQYPKLENNTVDSHHTDIYDFWDKLKYNQKNGFVTPEVFKWFWFPNNKNIVSKSIILEQKIPNEQIEQIMDNYLKSIKQ